ncbi:MAG: hypothetical protein ACRCYU_13570 [Nocardioides sp.]
MEQINLRIKWAPSVVDLPPGDAKCVVLVRDVTYLDDPALKPTAAQSFPLSRDELSNSKLELTSELDIPRKKLGRTLAGRRSLNLEVTIRFGGGVENGSLAPGDMVNESELRITEDTLENGFDVFLTPVTQVRLDPHAI